MADPVDLRPRTPNPHREQEDRPDAEEIEAVQERHQGLGGGRWSRRKTKAGLPGPGLGSMFQSPFRAITARVRGEVMSPTARKTPPRCMASAWLKVDFRGSRKKRRRVQHGGDHEEHQGAEHRDVDPAPRRETRGLLFDDLRLSARPDAGRRKGPSSIWVRMKALASTFWTHVPKKARPRTINEDRRYDEPRVADDARERVAGSEVDVDQGLEEAAGGLGRDGGGRRRLRREENHSSGTSGWANAIPRRGSLGARPTGAPRDDKREPGASD